MHKLKNNFAYIYFISILFESITLVQVGSFSVTLTFLVSLIFMLFSVIDIIVGNSRIDLNELCIFASFIIYLLLSIVLASEKTNLNAIFLYSYFLVLYLVSKHDYNERKLKKTINIFNKIVLIASIYAIYQFIAYNFMTGLPFKELIPTEFMTPNYNTIAKTHQLGMDLYRAHAFFLEASVLSQFTAISMLFLLSTITRRGLNMRNFLAICINAIALVLSLSGTGLIILLIGGIYLFVKLPISSLNRLGIICVVVGLCCVVLFSSLGQYFLNRLNEFSVTSTNSSAYYRFILPFIISISTLVNNFFGYGAGNDDFAMMEFGALEDRIASGFGKVFAELGLIGFILLIVVLMSLKPKKELKNLLSLNLIFLLLIVSNFVSASMVLDRFWVFAVLLNIQYPQAYKDSKNSTVLYKVTT